MSEKYWARQERRVRVACGVSDDVELRRIPGFDDYWVTGEREPRLFSFRTKNPKPMKYWENKKGRRFCKLREFGGTKECSITLARVVCMAFHGEPDGGSEVFACHLDGDRHNDHYENLAWGTYRANHVDSAIQVLCGARCENPRMVLERLGLTDDVYSEDPRTRRVCALIRAAFLCAVGEASERVQGAVGVIEQEI